MKTALNMIFYYFAACFFGAIAGAGIYMLSCDLTLMVVGEEVAFFNGRFFVEGIFAVLPAVASVSLGFTIFYGIRHRENHFFRLGAYSLLCAFTWLCLVPLCFNMQKSFEAKTRQQTVPANPEQTAPETPAPKPLSAGFFRPEAGGVFYFSRVEDNGNATGLFIDLSGITGEVGKTVRFFNSPVEDVFAGKYADTLIRDAAKIPLVLTVPLKVYSVLMENARSAWNSGWFSWLCFLTFALALSSVVAYQYTSSWRLINVVAVIFASGVVCLINYAWYAEIIFKNLRLSWRGFFSPAFTAEPALSAENMSLVQNHAGSFEPLLAVINLFIFALFFVTGILLFFFKYRNKKEAA